MLSVPFSRPEPPAAPDIAQTMAQLMRPKPINFIHRHSDVKREAILRKPASGANLSFLEADV